MRKNLLLLIALLLPVLAFAVEPAAQGAKESKEVKKVLFIGDSMTGWLSERLTAYGEKNGFEVATVVWDGSTLSKWANTSRTAAIISQRKPDAIFVSLGMNEMFEKNPQARFGTAMSKLKKAFGDIPVVWIGPPKWVGKSEGAVMDRWLEQQIGSDHYFSSLDLNLPRQSKTNQHPTKPAMASWMDSVLKWVKETGALNINLEATPEKGAMKRGKVFIYKRMKETL